MHLFPLGNKWHGSPNGTGKNPARIRFYEPDGQKWDENQAFTNYTGKKTRGQKQKNLRKLKPPFRFTFALFHCFGSESVQSRELCITATHVATFSFSYRYRAIREDIRNSEDCLIRLYLIVRYYILINLLVFVNQFIDVCACK